MNKKNIFLIILPALVLSSCNETTAEDFSKFLLTYEDFKNVIKEKDYKTLIKDGKYLYSESIVSDNMSTTLNILSDLVFYDAFKGECSSFYADYYTRKNDNYTFEKWMYDGEYFNYSNCSDVPFTKTVGKYGKNVNFDYRFNLKTFYQLFVDGEFEHVVLADYFKYHSSYWVSFSEQTYFNKIKVEENTNIYFDRDDFSLIKIIQNTSFYSEGNMTKSETKILSSIVYDQNNVMDKSSDEYVDLSGTCLPNVEF